MTKTSSVQTERRFKRMTLNQRIQHVTLMTSFFTLVITGFPVTYPNNPVASGIIRVLGSFETRALVHRGAAVILTLLTIYHLFYMFGTKYGRSELRAMMPKFQDALDAIQMLKFYVGLAPTIPRFDRFNYIEKFEYLALAWGTVVMVATGAVLAFQNKAMIILPKWALDVAKVIHGYEALLAFLAIIIWHFYHVHLNPEVFPMSRVWIDGEIPEHEMKTLHPLEYERILAREAAEAKKQHKHDCSEVVASGIGDRKE